MNEETHADKKLILWILLVTAITFVVGLILYLSGLNIWFNEFFYTNSITYAIFSVLTQLGDVLIYILLIVIVWYAYDKRFGKNLAFSLFGSYLINSVLKDIFQDPRPWTNIRDAEPVEEGFGFPSGHAQQAVPTWGYLAYESYQKKNKILFWIFFIIVYIIAGSRVILGVHDVQDVWGGLTFGFLWLILFILLEPKISAVISTLSLIIKVILSIAIPIVIFLVMILVFPSTTLDYGMINGAMMGLSLGYLFECEKIKYDPKVLTNGQKVLNIIIGLILALVFYFGLSLAFPESQIMDFIQYFLLSFILVGLVPWIFVKINRKS